jgi:hypothetical protein
MSRGHCRLSRVVCGGATSWQSGIDTAPAALSQARTTVSQDAREKCRDILCGFLESILSNEKASRISLQIKVNLQDSINADNFKLDENIQRVQMGEKYIEVA